MTPDHVIVGSGLTGATIARLLADAGRRVLVLERRPHLGGNVHDQLHPSGIRIHTYGPHYFRTNSSRIWSFVRRFGEFYRYEAVLASLVDGRYEHWPVTREYIEATVGPAWSPPFTGRPANFEEACLAMMPSIVYRRFVQGYTEKQWGVKAEALSPALAGRFEVQPPGEVRLKRHRYQALPRAGYEAWVAALLDGVPVVTDCDYLLHRAEFRSRRTLVFTGPIDEFFGFALGRLAYRGQRRQHVYLPDTDLAQPFVQVNTPSPADGDQVRIIEWKHLMPAADRARVRGSVITREVPYSPDDPGHFEYPFPDEANQALFAGYRKLAADAGDVLICGRLGDYRYYDMDHAIARAMHLARQLLRA